MRVFEPSFHANQEEWHTLETGEFSGPLKVCVPLPLTLLIYYKGYNHELNE